MNTSHLNPQLFSSALLGNLLDNFQKPLPPQILVGSNYERSFRNNILSMSKNLRVQFFKSPASCSRLDRNAALAKRIKRQKHPQ